MADVAKMISAQVDLLWSVALAMLLAEVFLLAKFFSGSLGKLDWLSKLLLFISIASLTGSMFSGYLAYGAAVEVIINSSSELKVETSLKDAGISALIQFAGFAVGLISFLIAFFLNSTTFGKAANDKAN